MLAARGTPAWPASVPGSPTSAREPVLLHLLQEFRAEGKTGCRAEHRIDPAMRAHRSLAVVPPLADGRRRKRLQAIEAAALSALLDFRLVPARGLVGALEISH